MLNEATTITLQIKPGVLVDGFSYILKEAAGKTVLNIGAAGGMQSYLPNHKDICLHYRLIQVAQEVVGIDIDKISIAYAREHGVEIMEADCETLDLGQHFDLIIMSDVIEHLNAPATAIQQLVKHLNPGGRLIITTPNPTYIGLLVRAIFRRSLNIYYDHVTCFLPEHIQAICHRFNYQLVSVYFFGHIDRRNIKYYAASSIVRLAGVLSPRLMGSFMAIIQR